MKRQVVNRFDGGWAQDIYSTEPGKFAACKNFDISSYPNRLKPIRCMSSDTASTLIGNLLLGVDGKVYGLGQKTADPTQAGVWVKAAIGAGSAFSHIANSNNAQAIDYECFFQYPSNGTRSILYGDRGGVETIDPAGALAISGHTLVNTYIAQGYVHPKNDRAFIPYMTNAPATKIAMNNATSWTDTALTLPNKYTPGKPTHYGNYLAIPCYEAAANKSVVVLWDMDTSLATINEVIDWGDGLLKVLANLDGVLIGITDLGNNAGNFNVISDYDSVQIKVWAGGEPIKVAEIPTTKETTTAPNATINPRVNFISRGKLYFSVNIDGGSTSPTHYGLWALSKNSQGRYAATLERFATTANTETGVIAAVIGGDYSSMVHTAEGTLTTSISASAFSDIYGATSIYESLVNPAMADADRNVIKKLFSIECAFLPLTSSGQVALQYRVDGGSWTDVETDYVLSEAKHSDSATRVRRTQTTSAQFKDGTHYQFRIKSTYGAEIVELAYKYDPIPALI